MTNIILDKIRGGLIILTGLCLLLPILFVVIISTYIASIPSRIGERVQIEDWIYRGIKRSLDIDTMQNFRDDIYNRIRPHLSLSEDYERWWIIRQMEKDRDRINSALLSGEYVIIIALAVTSILLDISIYGIPISVVSTLLAVGLSGLVIIRVVTIKILMFRPELYAEEPTHDLAVRMAFNRGPLSRGSSIGLALLTLLVGLAGERGYEVGLSLVEMVAEATYSPNTGKWRAD